jgi:hypothetical protein
MMKGTRQWILVATFAMLAGFRFLDRTPGRWPPRFFTIIIPVIGVALVTFLTVNWIRARKAREQAQPSDRNR